MYAIQAPERRLSSKKTIDLLALGRLVLLGALGALGLFGGLGRFLGLRVGWDLGVFFLTAVGLGSKTLDKWCPTLLNRLCWAIGSISGAMQVPGGNREEPGGRNTPGFFLV